MKKLLLILMFILLGCIKGYSQLLQSNSIWPSGKKWIADTVQHLQKVTSQSDQLVNSSAFSYNGQTEELKKTVKILQDKIKEGKPKQNNDNKKIDDLTLLKFTQYDIINSLSIDKYTVFLTALDKDLEKYNNEIQSKMTRAATNFDTVVHSKNAQIQHYNDSLSNAMNIKSFVMKAKLDSLVHERNTLNDHLLELKQQYYITQNYKSVKDYIYSKAEITKASLNTQLVVLADRNKKFVIEYNAYVETVNNQIDALNKSIKDDNKDESEKQKAVSALGGINKVFGDQGALIPNITVVGQKKFSSDVNSSFYGEVKLFIGGNDDNKKNTGSNNLFIPEASTYGFMTDFVFGFIASNKQPKHDKLMNKYEQKLAITIGAYYLGKKLQPDTVTRFNINLFHIKLGLQYVIIPRVLSTYINANYVLAATNINQFEKYYSNVQKVKAFTSFGLESYLDLNDVKDFHLLINLGFVNINDNVKSWVNSSDKVIPNVKLSLVKTFNF